MVGRIILHGSIPLVPDQLPPHEHWEQHLSAFAACFLPRRDCYAQQTSTGYRLVKAPLTLALVRDHLMGKLTPGAAENVPIHFSEENGSMFEDGSKMSKGIDIAGKITYY